MFVIVFCKTAFSAIVEPFLRHFYEKYRRNPHLVNTQKDLAKQAKSQQKQDKPAKENHSANGNRHRADRIFSPQHNARANKIAAKKNGTKKTPYG